MLGAGETKDFYALLAVLNIRAAPVLTGLRGRLLWSGRLLVDSG